MKFIKSILSFIHKRREKILFCCMPCADTEGVGIGGPAKSQSYMVSYASVTFALRRVYVARTMSKSPFPCGLRRETLRSSYGFTGIVTSTILFNSAQ